MIKCRLLIVIVVFAVGTFVAFSLGTILARPAPNDLVDSGCALCVGSCGCALCADGCGCSIRPDPDALSGLVRWWNEVNEWSSDAPIVWIDSDGGHAASGW